MICFQALLLTANSFSKGWLLNGIAELHVQCCSLKTGNPWKKKNKEKSPLATRQNRAEHITSELLDTPTDLQFFPQLSWPAAYINHSVVLLHLHIEGKMYP